MASKKKKVAVLGAGFFGLTTLVALEEEGGFDPVCFEKTDKPGGTWCYREETEDCLGSTMSTTIINISKELGALSTFPPKKESNNFMRHHEFYGYIMDYARSSDVLKYIRYNMQAVEVKRCEDYEKTGRWTVTVKNRLTGELTTDVYDGVLVCVGIINSPRIPSYPGQELFKGKIMHTHSLKRVEPYRDKIVVVVGMGCSGLDAAVETSNVAKQVYLSTRSGSHVIRRVGHHGLPFDIVAIRPYLYQLMDIFGYKFYSWLFQLTYLDLQFNQNLYAVKPHHWVLAREPVMNDHFESKLLSGSVIQKPGLERFTENGVVFEGDEEATECDVVIMATGYTWKLPFLEEGIVVTEENGRINLYKCMYPPHLAHGTLAILGFIIPFGAIFPAGELQARWATQILAGKCKLPSEEVMVKDIEKRHQANVARFGPLEKVTLRVDIIQYCDELAAQIGAKPNLYKYLLTDINLLLKILFGPSVSYQYRLQGPHAWDGARDAIMTTMERVVWPMTRRRPEEVQDGFLKRLLQSFSLLLMP